MSDAKKKEPRICQCGRPKWTDADLARWQKEFGAGDNAKPPAEEPAWAREICWSNAPRCPAARAVS